MNSNDPKLHAQLPHAYWMILGFKLDGLVKVNLHITDMELFQCHGKNKQSTANCIWVEQQYLLLEVSRRVSCAYSVCFWRWTTRATCRIAPSDTGWSVKNTGKMNSNQCATKYPCATYFHESVHSQPISHCKTWNLCAHRMDQRVGLIICSCCWANGSFKVQDNAFSRKCLMF